MPTPMVDYARKAFGRFATVRAGYGMARGLFDRPNGHPASARGYSAVEPFDVAAAVRDIHQKSVHIPVRLRDEAVQALRKLAIESPIRATNPQIPLMTLDEANEYNRAGKRPIFLYGSVPAAENSEVALSVVHDPQILDVARRYLGYTPTRRRMRLQWSLVCDYPPMDRMHSGQTVFYHYDADDFNFVYSLFYLTEVDEKSGAHIMIPGTHKDKPMSWLLGRSWRTDEEVFTCYSRDREMLIGGPPGFGFLQDSSCMHKALAPAERPRLVLQVRYS